MTKQTEHPSAAVRIRVMKRDRFQCTYCGTPGTDAELEVDHIIAVAHGGSHHMSNLTTACRACNQRKGSGELVQRRAKIPVQHRTETRSSAGLVGMFLWTLVEDKEIIKQRGSVPPGMRVRYQGCIVGLHGDVALVQLFSFLDGTPTHVIPIAVSDVLSGRCVLFANNEAMLTAAEKYDAADKHWRASMRDDELERLLAEVRR
jgi:hypothetical protein